LFFFFFNCSTWKRPVSYMHMHLDGAAWPSIRWGFSRASLRQPASASSFRLRLSFSADGLCDRDSAARFIGVGLKSCVACSCSLGWYGT
jgi:hypothetical protein